MNSLPRLLLAALLLAASAAGRAQSIAELPDDKFKLIVDKIAIYDKALAAARIIEKSYDRYATWVDIKTGPTAKEKTVDGLPDIAGAGQDIANAGATGPGMWPPLTAVDDAAL